ncbi:hypothetical protein F5Y00DRAFT_79108 [Daldinia vernicosa]|uniref:uncharacterized protein n=1 Tax=Daldinia vernicosa TaxID=114800 RepID=UPI0020084DA8|nr:uncharacterized protein F5Y00DRAFT_79108 [Daldinia vernicosa]KAI0848976.1 hypothetical protein F5Y00DRAFT_79108 [Daldinia vernicosa]
MRFPYMLLALVASVTADNTAQTKWSDERELALKSRRPLEITQALAARLASVDINHKGVVVSRDPGCDPDSDDPDLPFCDKLLEHIKEQQEKEENEEKGKGPGDDDDDNDENRHSSGMIAGAVIGAFIALLFLLAVWYFLRIRPRRRQRILEQRRKQDELESNYQFSPPGAHLPTPPTRSMPGSQDPSEHNVRFQRTPYPGNAPSPSMTNSSMSGLALPTPALTYSPSVTSSAVSPLSPVPAHGLSDKPPAYAAVAALQSSEPQPEASAYQMGQTPMPLEPPMYHLTEAPRPAIMDIKGEPLPRY